MELQDQPIADKKMILFLGLAGLILAWGGFLLTLSGFFHRWIIIVLGLGVLLWLGYQLRKIISSVSRSLWLIVGITLATVLVFSFFSVPTIFSGRDQGAISEAAIRLAQNHQLEFSTPESQTFFQIYGPGKALNFPGFYYTPEGKLSTQFPLVYIAWLGLFFSVFGYGGLVIANTVLFFLFVLTFYSLGRTLGGEKTGRILLAFALTAFLFSWFLKFTLSENIALFLLWFGIWNLIEFWKSSTSGHYIALLLSFGLLFFARVEGIIFLPLALGLLFWQTRKNGFWTTNRREKIVIPAIIFLAFFLLNLENNFYFYREIGKVLLSHESSLIDGGQNLTEEYFSSGKRLLAVFSLYGILGFFLTGILGTITLFKKRAWLQLIPLFITLPAFIYLIDSNISPDHPWMIRRFVFAVFPALILYATLFLAEIEERGQKKLFRVILILLFWLAIFPFLYFLPLKENAGLVKSTEILAQKFGPRDLVLVDQLASGDGWSLLSGPLSFRFGKHSVYFFNPDDAEKIDYNHYSCVWLVVPDEAIEKYQSSALGSRLEASGSYTLQTSRLKIASEKNGPVVFPEYQPVAVSGKIFKLNPPTK